MNIPRKGDFYPYQCFFSVTYIQFDKVNSSVKNPLPRGNCHSCSYIKIHLLRGGEDDEKAVQGRYSCPRQGLRVLRKFSLQSQCFFCKKERLLLDPDI